jgi:Ni/Co efflux regulator RcnB
MKRIIIASAIALASLAASAIPSSATTIVIGDNGSNYHRHYDNRRGYDDRRDWDHHRHHRDCYTKRYTGWHHGHKVYQERRVCR